MLWYIYCLSVAQGWTPHAEECLILTCPAAVCQVFMRCGIYYLKEHALHNTAKGTNGGSEGRFVTRLRTYDCSFTCVRSFSSVMSCSLVQLGVLL